MISAEARRGSAPQVEPADYHPTFRHARREGLFILALWAACLAWSIPYCYVNGYLHWPESFDPHAIPTVLGIPSWVFWGIAVPWLLADVVTTWFCFAYMRDDDLGAAHEDADVAEDLAAQGGVPPQGEDAS
jgi:hypothetical protein